MARSGFAAIIALAMLTACGDGGEPGGVTAEESRQLNEAAAMLDAAPDTAIPTDETGLANAAADTGDVLVTAEPATNGQ